MISVVIPAYNEADNIEHTLREVKQALGKDPLGAEHEIIVVDDHSSDGTFSRVAALQDGSIDCVRLSRRSGSHTAVRAGLALVSGEVILCVSADGQDDPEALRELLEKWRAGASIVWAVRKSRQEPMHQKILANTFYRLLSALTRTKSDRGDIDLMRADFCLLDQNVVGAVNACHERNTSLFGLLVWLGFEQETVSYRRRARLSGKSKWDWHGRFRLARDWVIAFSGLPLRFVTYLGIGVSISGFSYALFIIVAFVVFRTAVQGWASLMVVVLLLSGVQMIIMGTLGEYLWRNLDESRKRPLYFIEKRASDEKSGIKRVYPPPATGS